MDYKLLISGYITIPDTFWKRNLWLCKHNRLIQEVFGCINYYAELDTTISEIQHSRFFQPFCQLTKMNRPKQQRKELYASYPKSIQNSGYIGL